MPRLKRRLSTVLRTASLTRITLLFTSILAHGALPSAGPTADSIDCAATLVDIAYLPSESLNARQRRFFADCKNQPRQQATTVDLNAEDLCSYAEQLQGIPSPRFSQSRTPRRLSEYERRVLSLRPGDTVQSGETSIVLGAFLGRGNASHVFAIRDQPNEAIKIPFYIIYPPHNLTKGRDMLRVFDLKQDRIPHSVRRVHVVRRGQNYEFITVNRVDSEFDGLIFLNRWNRRSKHGPAAQQMEQQLRQAVLFLMEAEGRSRMSKFQFQDEYPMYAIQFLWDRTLRAWVLVDWE